MALIKCPECGKDVSSTLDSCPHCGFRIASPGSEIAVKENPVEKAKESDKPTVIIKRNTNVPNTIGFIEIIIGLFLSIAIIGIGLIVGGCIVISQISKNNSQAKDILYYDPKTNLFIAYDKNGKSYEIAKTDLVNAITFATGAKGYTGVMFNKNTQLGWATAEANDKFRSFVGNL